MPILRRLILIGLLALMGSSLAQPDNPRTWLRLLDVPMLNGPIESTTITTLTNIGEIYALDEWTFGPNNIPIARHQQELFSSGAPTEVVWQWTVDESGFPVRIEITDTHPDAQEPTVVEIRKTPSGFMRITRVPGVSTTTEDFRFDESHHRVEVHSEHLLDNYENPHIHRSVIEFDTDWAGRSEALAAQDSSGKWFDIGRIGTDTTNVRVEEEITIGSSTTIEVVERDLHANPVRADMLRTFGSQGGNSFTMTWKNTYHDAPPPANHP